MATDRNGTTIEDGDDIVVIGKRRGSAGSGRSLIVVGDTPIVVADSEIVAAESLGGGSLPFCINLCSDATNAAAANLAASDRWFPRTSELFVVSVPGDLFAEVRFYVTVMTAANSGAVVDLVYRTSWSDAHADYSDIAASGHVRCAIDAVGVADSGWIDIHASAQVDPVFLGMRSSGGDGAADPAIGRCWALFR